MFKKILATNKTESKEELNILFLCLNRSHYKDALIMAKKSPFNCFIFSCIDQYDIIETKFDNIKIIPNIQNCIPILATMDRVIVPVFLIAPTYPKEIKKILALAVRLEIPIINVPHGIFEPGKNVRDTSTLIDFNSRIHGIGGLYRSFSDRHLSWYGGEMEIGYPHTAINMPEPSRIIPSYTLITTNSNWYLYGFDGCRKLFANLFLFAESHPDRFFIWAAHPAEFGNDSYAKGLKNRRPSNVFIYGIENDVYFHGIDSTEELIFFCENGISTTTTCLLDFELYKKSVHVFECDGTKALTDNLAQVSYFKNASDLEQPAKQIITGYLKEYRPDLFEKYVREATVTLGKERAYLLEASALMT